MESLSASNKPSVLGNITLDSIDISSNRRSVTKGLKSSRIEFLRDDYLAVGDENSNACLGPMAEGTPRVFAAKIKKTSVSEPGICPSVNEKGKNEMVKAKELEVLQHKKCEVKEKTEETLHQGTPRKRAIALFIGGLGDDICEDQLRDVFGKYPSLVSVKICYDSATKDSLGYGYLNFQRQEDVDRCTEDYNYTKLFGREIKLMPSLRNSSYRKNIGTNIFFSNLPTDKSKLTTRYFYDTFRVYGRILSCKLDVRKHIGFVYFEDDKDALKAIKDFNNKDFLGAKIACGLHFDKELRDFPDFDKRKSKLDSSIILEEELIVTAENDPLERTRAKNQPHPNAVFVKNLPPTVTDDQILDYFSSVGPIKSVFSSSVKRFKAKWAFVTYKVGKDSERSIEELNGRVFEGNTLSVSKAKVKRRRPGGAKQDTEVPHFYLSNLSGICDERFLSQLCAKNGLHFQSLAIIGYDVLSCTYFGVMTFKNMGDLRDLSEYLNHRLLGGSIVRVSPEKPEFESGCIPQGNPYSPKLTKGQHQSSPPAQTMLNFLPYPIQPAQQDNYKQLKIPPNCLITRGREPREITRLKKQVKRAIKYLKLPMLDSNEDITRISQYIVHVFWCSNLELLGNFLEVLNLNIHYEHMLHQQIVESIKSLGFADIRP